MSEIPKIHPDKTPEQVTQQLARVHEALGRKATRVVAEVNGPEAGSARVGRGFDEYKRASSTGDSRIVHDVEGGLSGGLSQRTTEVAADKESGTLVVNDKTDHYGSRRGYGAGDKATYTVSSSGASNSEFSVDRNYPKFGEERTPTIVPKNGEATDATQMLDVMKQHNAALNDISATKESTPNRPAA